MKIILYAMNIQTYQIFYIKVLLGNSWNKYKMHVTRIIKRLHCSLGCTESHGLLPSKSSLLAACHFISSIRGIHMYVVHGRRFHALHFYTYSEDITCFSFTFYLLFCLLHTAVHVSLKTLLPCITFLCLKQYTAWERFLFGIKSTKKISCSAYSAKAATTADMIKVGNENSGGNKDNNATH